MKKTIIFSSVVGTLTLAALLFMTPASATDNTDVVDEINITVPISCTMSGTGMTSHTANMSNGSYTPNIGTTTLKVFCNDTEGFAIFAAGYTGDEIGGTNSTKLVNSASAVDNTISTGTATSGNTSNWAMKLATNSSATYAVTLDNGFGAYSAVPSSYTKVAHRDSGTDIGTTATGAELTTTYAAFVNQTQPAGTYVGKVIYTLVHPSNEAPAQPVTCDSGKICYNPNTATALGEMGKQSASNNASVDLWASNFKRDGYGFAGWNTAYDYSGTNYGPNQTITAPADVQTNGLSLYAVWIKSAGTIQNWDGCNSLAQGATTALTDERDGNTYAVAKLADGKCWTIENLRLADKDASNNDIELSSTNTHNPSLPLNNSWYYKNQQGTLTTSNHLSTSSDPTSTSPDTAWCQTDSSDCDDQSMLATNNTTLFTGNTSTNYSASSNVYSYGNYYNWYSATAGHGKYGSDYGQGYEAPGDICPAGWHLPKGGDKSQESTNEFWQLIVTGLNGGTNPANYDSSTTPYYAGTTEGTPVSNVLRFYPNNFVYSGSVNGSSVNSRGSNGLYWSSSANFSYYYAYNLFFNSSLVFPGTNYDFKYLGSMVRCVAGV